MFNGDRPIYTVPGWIFDLNPDLPEMIAFRRSCDRQLASYPTDKPRAAISADPECRSTDCNDRS
jgi:hypothetical protein